MGGKRVILCKRGKLHVSALQCAGQDTTCTHAPGLAQALGRPRGSTG